MTAGQINAALDRLDQINTRLVDAFIAAGRGRWRASEIYEAAKRGDGMSVEQVAVWDRGHVLRNEIQRRYGPGAPSRLPRGFGPRSRG